LSSLLIKLHVVFKVTHIGLLGHDSLQDTISFLNTFLYH